MAEIVGITAGVAQLTRIGVRFIYFAHTVFKNSGDMFKECEEILLAVSDIEATANQLLSDKDREALEKDGDGDMLKFAMESKVIASELLALLKRLKVRKDDWDAQIANFQTGDDTSENGLKARAEKLRATIRLAFSMDDVRQLDARLHRLFGCVTRRTTLRMRDQLLSQVMDYNRKIEHDIRDLATVLKSVKEDTEKYGKVDGKPIGLENATTVKANFVELSKVVDEVVFGISVADTLRNLELGERFRQVKRTENGTVEWALNISKTGLNEWFRSKNGLFWIHGKPGSGKSTLMKHLAQSADTAALLKEWTGDGKLVTANHFFWSSGSEMQKSLVGLFRSLFGQVFEKHPSLICRVVQQQPNALQNIDLECLEDWFERLVAFAESNPDHKFCFLIDGLDEYGTGTEGHVLEIVDVAKKLLACKTPNMKMLISSQKLPTFRSAFKDCPDLQMEKFTLPDIELYAWKQLEISVVSNSNSSSQYKELARLVAQKAQGVWLWVFFVLQPMRRIVANNEGFEKAKRVLDEFPPDLQEYFSLTIGRTEAPYQRDGARLLLLAAEMERPFTLLGFCLFLNEPDNPEKCIRRLQQPFTDLPKHEELCLPITLQDRLNSRTMGLLELQLPEELQSTDLTEIKLDTVGAFHDIRIGFLHRSVRDYLQVAKNREELLEKAGTDFNLSLYTLILSIADNFEGMRSAEFYDGFTPLSKEIGFTENATEADALLCSYLDSEYGKQADSEDNRLATTSEPTIIPVLTSVVGRNAYAKYGSGGENMRALFELYISLANNGTDPMWGLVSSFRANLQSEHKGSAATSKRINFDLTPILQQHVDREHIQLLLWATNRRLLLYLTLTSGTKVYPSLCYSILLCWFLISNINSLAVASSSRNQRNLAIVYLFLEVLGADPNHKLGNSPFLKISYPIRRLPVPLDPTTWTFLLWYSSNIQGGNSKLNDPNRDDMNTGIYDLLLIFLRYGANPSARNPFRPDQPDKRAFAFQLSPPRKVQYGYFGECFNLRTAKVLVDKAKKDREERRGSQTWRDRDVHESDVKRQSMIPAALIYGEHSGKKLGLRRFGSKMKRLFN